MAVRLRLRRMGAKKKPFYRIVAIDSAKGRSGRYIENLGTYDPLIDPPVVTLKESAIITWLGKGAQASQIVSNILKKAGVLERFSEKVG